MTINRVILIVLDGVGVGELSDAADFEDVGSNSLANTAKAVGGLNLPNLQKMGLGNLTDIKGVAPEKQTTGAYGKMCEISKGKDSIVGHWELAGVISSKSLPVFPNNFPHELIAEFEKRINRETIGNIHASGTEIINELGDEHVKTGKPIIYTSVDSVFQIAAHEEIIPIPDLYEICEKARELLKGEFGMGRVIARPFLGESGNYYRTESRKDWSLPPPGPTVLDRLKEMGNDVIAIGKIDGIFAFHGITQPAHIVDNQECINKAINFLNTKFEGLLFVNLIEFDMIYGHRNNYEGYAQALIDFDKRLPEIRGNMLSDDILIITSDHGNDPTTPSTDHSREYVPLLVCGDKVKSGVNLGIRSTFADVGNSIANIFKIKDFTIGRSFINDIV